MASRDVSIVSSGSRKMTVETSRKTTTITSSSGGGQAVTSSTTEYSVRQSGQGGQVLDQPTGLPRVEMTFAVDPSLQQTSVAAAPPVLTVYCYRLV